MKCLPFAFIAIACLLPTTRVLAQDSCQQGKGQGSHAELFLGANAVYNEITGQKDVWEGLPSNDLKAVAVNAQMSTVYAGRWGEHIQADLVRYASDELDDRCRTLAIQLMARTNFLTREELVKIGVRPMMDQTSYVFYLEKSVSTFGGMPAGLLGDKRLVLKTNLRWALEDNIITKDQHDKLFQQL